MIKNTEGSMEVNGRPLSRAEKGLNPESGKSKPPPLMPFPLPLLKHRNVNGAANIVLSEPRAKK